MANFKSSLQVQFSYREYLEQFSLYAHSTLDLHFLPAFSEEYFDFSRRREPDFTVEDAYGCEDSSGEEASMSLSGSDEEEDRQSTMSSNTNTSITLERLRDIELPDEKSYRFKCKLFNEKDDKPCKFVPHKLVDLCRLFFLRSSARNPYWDVGYVPTLVARFVVNYKSYEVTLVCWEEKKKFHFRGEDCVHQLADCLLSFNRHSRIYCLLIEGFLFTKLRWVIENIDDRIAFEVLSNCSVNPRGCYVFRNRFGMFFICYMKKDLGHTQPFHYETYCTIPSVFQSDPMPYDADRLENMAHIMSRDHARFQRFWRCWNGLVYFFLSTPFRYFTIPACVIVDFGGRSHRITFTISARGLFHTRIFTDTPAECVIENVRFTGSFSLLKLMEFLMDSGGKLFDCNYYFHVKGTGFYQALFTMFGKFPNEFPIVHGSVCDSSFWVFFTQTGKTHCFKRTELPLSGKFSASWVCKFVAQNHAALRAKFSSDRQSRLKRIRYTTED